MRFFLSAILASLLITRAQAFGIPPAQRAQTNKPSTTELSIFGNALKGAFSNDDSLGKQQNAGLKGVRCKIGLDSYERDFFWLY
mmetsp:Transcript_56068/g.167823  ORF Transcript_56068/g.167823 Transcript_56068/m.167823 type:complete len:84 (+) Transcript_56068:197-448(+)